MSVEVYSGGWPDYPYERQALLSLIRDLQPLEDWYILFVRCQFPGGVMPDLVVFKRTGVFIVELKHAGLPVHGGINGPWEIRDENGAAVGTLPGGSHENPYQQVIHYWNELRDFLRRGASKIWPIRGEEVLKSLSRGRLLRSLIVFYLEVPADSNVNLDWKVPCLSFPELKDYLWAESGRGVDFEAGDIQALARYLALKPYADVTSLLHQPDELATRDWEPYRTSIRETSSLAGYVERRVRVHGETLAHEDALARHARLLLHGPAGAGKTSALARVELSLLERIPDQIPVRLELDLYQTSGGLGALVEQTLKGRRTPFTDPAFGQLLATQEIVLLMDGWTEVPPVCRSDLQRDLRRWINEFPHHRIIVSARRSEWRAGADASNLPGPGFVSAELVLLR